MLLSQQLTIEQAISRAKKAVKQGNTALALKLYNAVLQNQPNHPVAKKGLRKIQNELPRNQSTQAETANPPQDQINTLTNLYHSGQPAETEKACRELLKAYPQSPVTINILGATLQGQGKLQEAVANYNRAIQIRPNYANAYSNRGTALQELGRLEDALESSDALVLPSDGVWNHPLLALVRPEAVLSRLVLGDRRPLHLQFAEMPHSILLEDASQLRNVNHPDDLE